MCLVACGGIKTVKSTPTPPTSASKPAPVQSSPPVANSSSTKPGGYYLDDGPGDNPPQDIDSTPNAVPRKSLYLTALINPIKRLARYIRQ